MLEVNIFIKLCVCVGWSEEGWFKGAQRRSCPVENILTLFRFPEVCEREEYTNYLYISCSLKYIKRIMDINISIEI